MIDVPKYKVVETTAMGETWWNVVNWEAPEDYDERNVFGSFSKSKEHAVIFCKAMNQQIFIPHPSVEKFVEKLPTVEARNKENI